MTMPGLRRVGLLAGLTAAVACGGEPEPITNPRSLAVESPFRYPLELWDRGVEGETVLMVHVTAMGDVDSVYVAEPSGHPAFDSAALAGIQDLKFSPGRQGERRVDMWARLPVRFDRADTTRSGATP